MATNELVPGESAQPNLEVAKIVDLVAKAAVVFAALIYGAGFLVISLHQYSYGLAGANPFRPKALAAGIWFLFFASAPF